MTAYSVIDNETGEVVLETDSLHLQAAHKLLQATDNRLAAHRTAQNSANSRDIDRRVNSHCRASDGSVTRKRHANTTTELAIVLLLLTVGIVLIVI
jgi:hypothetical protein